MKNCFARALATISVLSLVSAATADTTISTFDNFNLDGLFPNWQTATIVSGPTAYTITATGFGSGYKDINPNINATGETNIEVTVTLNGTGGPSDPISGPIVSLVDGDGTYYNYAWYGQTIGTHVLTKSLNSPSFISGVGTTPGLNLATLDFFHLQDDPGAYSGQYTISWENFRLTGAPPLMITSSAYNPETQAFTLIWTSRPGKIYTLLYSQTVDGAFFAWQIDIPSEGNFTTNTAMLPTQTSGFLRVQEQ
jgi:hypothetical protein